MADARTQHTATRLVDGRVLVAGGFDSTGYSASAALYNAGLGTWAPTSPMSVSKYAHSATLLANGQVLVVGGYSPDTNSYLQAPELWNPATGTWTITGSLTTGRSYHSATVLNNGKVLVAGGLSGDPATSTYYLIASAELYDPAAGTWTSAGSMATARFGHSATVLPNGKVLVAGGQDFDGNAFASAELYDPATGSWTAASSMPAARSQHTATLVNGRVLLAGGAVSPEADTLASAVLYDPATGAWASTGSMVTSRFRHRATLLENGQVLVAGGASRQLQLGGEATLSSAELYDPANGTWVATANMGTARENLTLTLLANGQVLAAGGSDANSSVNLSSAEVFNPRHR